MNIGIIYTLKPARRLDWRLTVLTTETDEQRLDDENINYLSISPKGKKVISNNYKADIKSGQQVFNLTDQELNKILDDYISM
jgi:hypothetical protein